MIRNPRWEQALIGTSLAFPTEVHSVTDVRPQDMAFVSHQLLWSIVIELERGNRLSYQAVVEKLHAQEKLEDLGADVEDGELTGELYLQELLARRAQPSIREFADNVVDASVKRELHSLAHLLALDTDSEKEADDLLDHVEEQIYQLRRHHVDSGRDMGDLLGTYEKVMDDWRNDRITPAFTFLAPGLAYIIPFLEPADFVLIAGRPGEGKCLGRGTKVLMFDGSLKVVEDVREGDLLMGPDSQPRRVLSTTRGRAMMYWVRQKRGIDYRVNERHILSLKRSKNEGSREHGEIWNVSVAQWINGNSSWQHRWKGYKVAVDFPEQAVPLEPYFLGLWLGDGTASNAVITNTDPEIISYLADYAERRECYLHSHRLSHNISRIKQGNNVRDGLTIRPVLRQLGVLGNKHIPAQYLRNSQRVRWEVLAGLIDTDGHMIHNGIEFTQKSLRLTQDIVFLANSLGLRVSPIHPHRTSCQTGAQGIAYRITIHGDFSECPIRIAYKKPSNANKRVDWRMTGIHIEPDKVDDYFGFMLDGDGLFLLEDMTVTHNSSLIRAEAFRAAMNGKKVVIFNLENSEIEYARYLIAHVTGIDTWKLRKPKDLTEHEVAQVREAVALLKSLPIRVVSMGSPSVHEIIRTARKLVSQGFEVIFVDYIQLIKNHIDNEVQDISMSSSLLRGFALKYNTPVIAAAQLNRELTKRTQGAEPQLSDLRGSGSLEQDALIVIFTTLLDVDEQTLRNFPQNILPNGQFVVRAQPMRLYVKKNRNGPVGRTDPILWDKSVNRFNALAADNPTPPAQPRRRQPVQGRNVPLLVEQ